MGCYKLENTSRLKKKLRAIDMTILLALSLFSKIFVRILEKSFEVRGEHRNFFSDFIFLFFHFFSLHNNKI